MNNKKLRQINTLIRENNNLKREYESSMRILERRKTDLEQAEAALKRLRGEIGFLQEKNLARSERIQELDWQIEKLSR